MTSKFTEEQREKAMYFLMNNNGLNIMPLKEFMTVYEPYEIAKMVDWADLKLDCAYIRVADYYSETKESDTAYDLISDDEIEEALEQLQ